MRGREGQHGDKRRDAEPRSEQQRPTGRDDLLPGTRVAAVTPRASEHPHGTAAGSAPVLLANMSAAMSERSTSQLTSQIRIVAPTYVQNPLITKSGTTHSVKSRITTFTKKYATPKVSRISGSAMNVSERLEEDVREPEDGAGEDDRPPTLDREAVERPVADDEREDVEPPLDDCPDEQRHARGAYLRLPTEIAGVRPGSRVPSAVQESDGTRRKPGSCLRTASAASARRPCRPGSSASRSCTPSSGSPRPWRS